MSLGYHTIEKVDEASVASEIHKKEIIVKKK